MGYIIGSELSQLINTFAGQADSWRWALRVRYYDDEYCVGGKVHICTLHSTVQVLVFRPWEKKIEIHCLTTFL